MKNIASDFEKCQRIFFQQELFFYPCKKSPVTTVVSVKILPFWDLNHYPSTAEPNFLLATDATFTFYLRGTFTFTWMAGMRGAPDLRLYSPMLDPWLNMCRWFHRAEHPHAIPMGRMHECDINVYAIREFKENEHIDSKENKKGKTWKLLWGYYDWIEYFSYSPFFCLEEITCVHVDYYLKAHNFGPELEIGRSCEGVCEHYSPLSCYRQQQKRSLV